MYHSGCHSKMKEQTRCTIKLATSCEREKMSPVMGRWGTAQQEECVAIYSDGEDRGDDNGRHEISEAPPVWACLIEGISQSMW